jgi:hypothetical protein
MTENESKILTKVNDKLEALHKRFDEHSNNHAVSDYKLAQLVDVAAKHGNALYGNGRPGLLTDMATIKKVHNWILGIAASVTAAIIIAHFVRR